MSIIINDISFLQYLINYENNFSFNYNDIMFCYYAQIKHNIYN